MPPVEVAADNEAAPPEEGASNALTLTDEVSTALVAATTYNTKVAALADEARKYHETTAGTVADPATVAGMATLVAIRARFRDDFRLPMQKAQEDGSKLFGTLQRKYNEHARVLIAEVAKLEKPWDDIITAEQERKAAIKAEKERLESARVKGHTEAIAWIASMPGGAAGLDSAGLRERIAEVASFIVDATQYEEFAGQAMQAKDEALRQLNGMLVAAVADEEERAELERTRQQQAAFRAEQAAREKALADEREAFEREKREHEAIRLREQEVAAQRLREEQEAMAKQQQELERQRLENERAVQERADAIEARMRNLRQLGATAHQAVHSADIKTLEGKVPAADTITADLYGDRVDEALGLRVAVLNTMAALHEQAVEREAREAAQARADKIEQLLAAIENMGEDASDAVKDGSAEMDKLRICLKELQDTACTPELFDDRVGEAVALKTAAEEIIEWAIKATQERDRLREEDAERMRKQEEADRLRRERYERMQANASKTYEVMKRLLRICDLGSLEHMEGIDSEAIAEARNIIEFVGEDHA